VSRRDRRAPPPPPRTLTAAIALLALGSGAVDALSFAALGTVFTSVMTGNLILLGVSIGQAEFAAAVPAVVAIAAYVGGVFAVARWLRGTRSDEETPWPLRVTAAVTAVAVAQAAVLVWWLATGGRPGPVVRELLIALSAAAMGVQSGAVNAVSVSGAATTYLTGTLTTLTTELATTGAPLAMRRRLTVLTAAFTGALLEALLLTWARVTAPALPLAATLAVIVVLRPRRLRARSGPPRA
jgi:uncharacterized membrane protein YoaK (UPF0700 family)